LGLTTLFLALATTMVAFAAMLVLMVRREEAPLGCNSILHKENMDGVNCLRHFVSSTRRRLALK
jgi:hypothetical protein